LAIRWVTEELLGTLNHNKKELEDVEIKAEHFIELLNLIDKKKITELKAKEILHTWEEKSSSPKEQAKKHSTISNSDEIEKIVKKIIKKNKKAVDDYKAGTISALNFLIGQVMRESNKRADYATAKKVLKRTLG